MRMTLTPFLALGLSLSPLVAQQSTTMDKLPGYYEFFMKTGAQVQIRAEKNRDAKIEEGELYPESVEKQLPDLVLPSVSGGDLRFLDYKGEKNLLVVSFRSWW